MQPRAPPCNSTLDPVWDRGGGFCGPFDQSVPRIRGWQVAMDGRPIDDRMACPQIDLFVSIGGLNPRSRFAIIRTSDSTLAFP